FAGGARGSSGPDGRERPRPRRRCQRGGGGRRSAAPPLPGGGEQRLPPPSPATGSRSAGAAPPLRRGGGGAGPRALELDRVDARALGPPGAGVRTVVSRPQLRPARARTLGGAAGLLRGGAAGARAARAARRARGRALLVLWAVAGGNGRHVARSERG